jgi:hypothetical protein
METSASCEARSAPSSYPTVLHSMRGSQRVCENLKGNRKPVGFAKAYLSGRQARAIYGTAKAVPFVQRRFFIQFFCCCPEAAVGTECAVAAKSRQAPRVTQRLWCGVDEESRRDD